MSDPAAVAALIAREGLPAGYADIVTRYWAPIADVITARRPRLVGINGAQGSGKSTMCLFLEPLLAARGLRAVTLSLDDVYLTKAERMAMAATVHPLFATRGVPGTHDLALADAVISALLHGHGPVAVPQFDKAVDDRSPVPRIVAAPVDVVLLEGWCIGATPEPEIAMSAPVNALEAAEDPDGRWRRAVNAALAGPYAALFAQAEMLVMLDIGRFDAVATGRLRQEHKLRARTGGGMDDAALSRFLAHYERLTRHMLRVLPDRADIVVPLGAGGPNGTLHGPLVA